MREAGRGTLGRLVIRAVCPAAGGRRRQAAQLFLRCATSMTSRFILRPTSPMPGLLIGGAGLSFCPMSPVPRTFRRGFGGSVPFVELITNPLRAAPRAASNLTLEQHLLRNLAESYQRVEAVSAAWGAGRREAQRSGFRTAATATGLRAAAADLAATAAEPGATTAARRRSWRWWRGRVTAQPAIWTALMCHSAENDSRLGDS